MENVFFLAKANPTLVGEKIGVQELSFIQEKKILPQAATLRGFKWY